MNKIVTMVLGGGAWALAWGQGQVMADELTQDQTDACGAILCLASAGAGGSACSGYLARYASVIAATPAQTVEQRQQFLNQCPSGTEDFNALAAYYGQVCEPEPLRARLNMEMALLEKQGATCMEENAGNCAAIDVSPDRWQAECGAWYANELVTYQPPQLVEHCPPEPPAGGWAWGAWVPPCTYRWEINATEVAVEQSK